MGSAKVNCKIFFLMLHQVIALSHHPVGGGLRYYTEWETQVVVEYGDVILFHAQGHGHSDFFNVVSIYQICFPKWSDII